MLVAGLSVLTEVSFALAERALVSPGIRRRTEFDAVADGGLRAGLSI